MGREDRKKEYGKRFLIFLIGVCLIQFGVAIFLELNIGADPFTVFTQGVAKLLHITPGGANRILTILIGIAVFIFERRYIKIGTILSIFCAGFLIDGMLLGIKFLQLGEYSVVVRCILFVVAMIPIAIAVPMIKIADVGVAPNDSVYFVLQERLNKPYGLVRILMDGVYFLLGVLCGGVIGIGTIICLLLFGPMVDLFYKRVEKVIAQCGYSCANYEA